MKTVAWLALVIAVIALILGWVAYNRTGENLEQQIQDAVAEALEETRDAVESIDDINVDVSVEDDDTATTTE
jgi:membrane protein implicated in regulation of membrane protease activity